MQVFGEFFCNIIFFEYMYMLQTVCIVMFFFLLHTISPESFFVELSGCILVIFFFFVIR